MLEGVLQVGVIGRQNAGKTLLLEQLTAIWSARGLRVAVLKHDGHAEQNAEPWTGVAADVAQGGHGSAGVLGTDSAQPQEKSLLPTDWEKPGSDTARFAAAGACVTMVAGGGQSLLRLSHDPDTRDPDALAMRTVTMAAAAGVQIDLVAAEGWKHSGWNMVAVLAHSDDLRWLEDQAVHRVRAIYCAAPLPQVAATGLQVYHYPHIRRLAEDILGWHDHELPGSR